eukprot:9489411-Pyramimonas_sp.AAC.1
MLQNSRTEGYSFEEVLQTLPKKNRARFAEALEARVKAATSELNALIESSESDDSAQESMVRDFVRTQTQLAPL